MNEEPTANSQPLDPVPPTSPAAPAAPPTAARELTEQPEPTPVVSPAEDSGTLIGSQLSDADKFKPEKNYKKIIVKVLVVLLIIASVFDALLATNIIALNTFKTVKYDNGKGDSFSLKFYSKHTSKNVAASTPSPSTSKISPDLKQLVSKESIGGKAPLTLWITSSTETASSYANNDCTKNNLSKAFMAKVDYINQDVVVCTLSQQDTDLIYIATFHDTKKGYLVYVSQDLDFNKILSSPTSAKQGLAKVGLKNYQDDIQTILASIKPIN